MRTICLCAILVCFLGGIVAATIVTVPANTSCRTERNQPDTNRRDSSKLSVRPDASSAKSWIKFDQLGAYDLGTVRRAWLRLAVHWETSDRPGTVSVSAVNDDILTNIMWVYHINHQNPEQGIYAITWNNAPANDTASYTSLLAGAATFMGTVTVPADNCDHGAQFLVDVTPAIQTDTDGIVQFVLHNSSGLMNFGTHNHPGGEAFWPTLLLRYPPAGADWPQPADEAEVKTTLAMLSWTNPEPNNPGDPIYCDVYLGTEPNRLSMTKVSLAADVSSVSVGLFGALSDMTRYYWVVDCTDPVKGLIEGEFWSFVTNNNEAPVVSAGADQVVWLDPNSVTVTLNGVTSDDGLPVPPGAYTVAWTQVATGAPAVTIDNSAQDTASVTFTSRGVYEFRLTADDGDKTTSDTVRIVVGTDTCDASHLDSGAPYNPADVNQDCVVDIRDFLALFGEDWLKCSDTLTDCQ